MEFPEERLFAFRALITTLFFAAAVFGGAHAVAGSWQFTYEGYLEKADGSAVETPTDLKFQILGKSGADLCVLREESQPQVPFTAGQFSVRIGSVAATSQAGTMQEIYRSAGAFTNLVKDDGGGGCTFDPGAAGAVRILRVFVGNEKAGDIILTSAPRALVAEKADDAATISGLGPADLVRVNNTAGLTQAKLEQFFTTMSSATGNAVKWNGTAFTAYDPTDGAALRNGTVADAAISSVAWSKVTGVPAALSAIGGLSCANGKILKMVAGAWSCGDETGVTVGTTTGTVAAGNDSRFGDADKIKGTAVDISGGVADNKVLTYFGGKWVPLAPTTTDASKLPLAGGDIAGAASGGPILTVKNTHTNGYSAIGFKNEMSAVTRGGVGIGNSVAPVPYRDQVFLASDTSLALVTNNAERVHISDDGKVGVGVGSPAYQLDVAGDVNITGSFMVNGAPIGGANGTLSSVGLLLPTDVFMSGPAITTNGNVSATFKSQGANVVFAGPDGTSGTPSFRALSTGDLPSGTFAAVSPLTAKGDLITRTASGPVRLPAGADGKYLKADSTDANGIKWADVYANDLTSLTGTGIVQKNGAGSFSTVNVNSPLSYSGGALGLAVGTGLTVGGTSPYPLMVDVGTGASQIPQLDVSGKLPASVIPANTTPWTVTSASDAYVGVDTTASVSGYKILRNSANKWALLNNVSGADEFSIFDYAGGGVPRVTVKNGGNVGIGTTTPQAMLDVAGGVRIGSDASGCTSTNQGTMRYNGSIIQFCNGSAWVGVGSKTIVLSQIKTYNYSGAATTKTYTYTKPSNLAYVIVETWGGGGGGSGTTSSLCVGGAYGYGSSFAGKTAGGGGFGASGAGGSGGPVGGTPTIALDGEQGGYYAGAISVNVSAAGGSAPRGGRGGMSVLSSSNGRPGLTPGGGGGGVAYGSSNCGGGGSGGYFQHQFFDADLSTNETATIGAGGAGGGTSLVGGSGAPGMIILYEYVYQ